MKYKKSTGENIFDVFNVTFMVFLIVITVYPFVYVIFASFSDPSELIKHTGMLWSPRGFTLKGYELVFKNEFILIGYANTIFYVLTTTVLSVLLTSFAAYALSRKSFLLKKTIMLGIVFTMFFSGGLIPIYLIVKGIGLYNTRLAVILPGVMSAYNMIIMRTSFMEIPYSLEESARIDGANDFTILFKIVLPVSKAVVAVMVLFYGVQHWNSWFYAMIYLKDREKYPLQLILREILIINSSDDMLGGDNFGSSMDIIIKYASIIVASVPIMLLYPFLQKYFVKGVMIGSVKG